MFRLPGFRMTHLTPIPSLQNPSPECLTFEQSLADFLDETLTPDARARLNEHRLGCAGCDALANDIAALVRGAGTLPTLTPARDLWSGIESRLDATVTPIAVTPIAVTPIAVTAITARPPGAASASRRTFSLRAFAIAATLLVAVTSGVTWRLARVRPQAGLRAPVLASTPPAASAPLPTAASALASAPTVPFDNAIGGLDTFRTSPSVNRVPARLTSTSAADVDALYEREIASLRQIVDARFTDLDSATVSVIRRNLSIIDAAIADSRRALRRDPRSPLLSTQLDRAIESKLALMRRVALL